MIPGMAWCAIVLFGDELAVPEQGRFRCDNACDTAEELPAECPPSHGEAPTLGVGKTDASASELLPQDGVLLPEVVDDRLLLTVDPALKMAWVKVDRVLAHQGNDGAQGMIGLYAPLHVLPN
jgi:hypothetical protein